VRRLVKGDGRHLSDEREDVRELRLEEGGFVRGEPEACQRRDAGNREVLALGGHGRC